ncbi:protease HtpX [Candidatus Profftia sp. (ex Adelges kitamiensis)]|uniref:protease HtpX n=1 Tax=Candidatus Profftia sp. (ex Adelges kitamiensis) TaxID=2864218 RepID=UPI001CE28308|nr:protease HtpX [Candidatus Profftia sp. (ex Adelges kitamiensis)]
MMRITLFLLTNLAIMLIFSVVLRLTGIELSSIQGLLITALLLGFGGSILSLLMSKWMALRSVGGEVINQPRNDIESWLVKTVNLQSQQVGVNMPTVAIYHAEDINAFATGPSRNSSLIAVSTGMLKNMSHDEIEAVLAHEISHISNGDMVTMMLIQGIVNTFVIFISRLIAQIIAGFFSSENDETEKHNNIDNSIIYLTISMILELVFAILASIITMWFSRYREFRADAGAANLVGNHKMIAALERLKTSYTPQEENHIITFCINGRNQSFSELFLSHPPLEKRIQALKILNT